MIRAYGESQPFTVYKEEEQATGDLVYRVKVKEFPPIELSLPLGDAIHNARSALDYLAWQLVIAGGGTPQKGTTFPISESQAKFLTNCQEGLKGSSPAAMAAVQALQPFSGGDDRFWRLHRLDIEDKHHLLVTVGAVQHGVNVALGIPGMTPIVLGMTPAAREFPLQDGGEVFRVLKAARESAEQGMGGAHSFSFDVAFGEGAVVSGEPIIPTLPDLIAGIESAVEPLFAHLT